MKMQAFLYDILDNGELICGTCRRRCVVLPNQRGWCSTRVSEDGKLYSLIYGEVASLSINPIEKKPVYHFLPGSKWLSIGSVGCNFRCPGCQNWEMSHWTKGAKGTRFLSPEECVAEAKEKGCAGLSWTFNEPAIWFEYTLDGATRAKAQYLHTNYVTNGSISEEAFDLIAPFLDVYRVDIKAFSQDTYRKIGHLEDSKGIFDMTQKAKARGLHVEIVTNIISGINDSAAELHDIATWIRDALGPETPWHVTRFYPHHLLGDVPPTPLATLENAWTIGRETGLWYVYLGNVPGHRFENTYCHQCGVLLIQRFAFSIIEYRIHDGRCPSCNALIPGKF